MELFWFDHWFLWSLSIILFYYLFYYLIWLKKTVSDIVGLITNCIIGAISVRTDFSAQFKFFKYFLEQELSLLTFSKIGLLIGLWSRNAFHLNLSYATFHQFIALRAFMSDWTLWVNFIFDSLKLRRPRNRFETAPLRLRTDSCVYCIRKRFEQKCDRERV